MTLRINTYDPATKTLTISPDTVKQRQMAAFFFWTSWVASTTRPPHRRDLHAELAA
jgi:nitric oxide reductase large subunit